MFNINILLGPNMVILLFMEVEGRCQSLFSLRDIIQGQ